MKTAFNCKKCGGKIWAVQYALSGGSKIATGKKYCPKCKIFFEMITKELKLKRI